MQYPLSIVSVLLRVYNEMIHQSYQNYLKRYLQYTWIKKLEVKKNKWQSKSSNYQKMRWDLVFRVFHLVVSSWCQARRCAPARRWGARGRRAPPSAAADAHRSGCSTRTSRSSRCTPSSATLWTLQQITTKVTTGQPSPSTQNRSTTTTQADAWNWLGHGK